MSTAGGQAFTRVETAFTPASRDAWEGRERAARPVRVTTGDGGRIFNVSPFLFAWHELPVDPDSCTFHSALFVGSLRLDYKIRALPAVSGVEAIEMIGREGLRRGQLAVGRLLSPLVRRAQT